MLRVDDVANNQKDSKRSAPGHAGLGVHALQRQGLARCQVLHLNTCCDQEGRHSQARPYGKRRSLLAPVQPDGRQALADPPCVADHHCEPQRFGQDDFAKSGLQPI